MLTPISQFHTPRGFWLLCAVVLAPFGIYAASQLLVSATPGMQHGSSAAPILAYLTIIALILAVPYLVLKRLFFIERREHPEEDELRLSDIPKYKDEVSEPTDKTPYL